MRAIPPVVLGAMAFLLAGCGDDATSPRVSSFAALRSVLDTDCGACHSHFGASLNLNNTFQTTMDSAALLAAGFINPRDPYQSVLILKPRNVIPHGGGRITSFTSEHERTLGEWIRRQPNLYVYRIEAARITPASAPGLDGAATDPAWSSATAITFPISGGWGDARAVTMRALHDGEYAYFVLQWKDDRASNRREPWVKQSDGTWRVAEAKPRPFDGWPWARNEDSESSPYLYEDKVALMWNTYGASTVAGFDQSGCAVTCHDPARSFGPGKTYFYADENRASKKYTNAQGEVADIWHWKFVRMNQHFKIDDQYVRYWQPNTGDPANGGRASDDGKGGYGANPATNGLPTYRNPATLTAPPFYILDSDKRVVTPQELAALPAGAMLPNMITSGPTGARADVDARGTHDAVAGTWTLEIRRKLITGDTKDVQFDNLAREYVFGVAVFDNAQIEHSYSSSPLRLTFQR